MDGLNILFCSVVFTEGFNAICSQSYQNKKESLDFRQKLCTSLKNGDDFGRSLKIFIQAKAIVYSMISFSTVVHNIRKLQEDQYNDKFKTVEAVGCLAFASLALAIQTFNLYRLHKFTS